MIENKKLEKQSIEKRCWSFDYLKLLFALLMCIYHVVGGAGWYIFVEMYFLISGIFIAKSAINKPQNTFKYIFLKWWTLFPYLFVVSLTFLIGNLIIMSVNKTLTVYTSLKACYLFISDIIPLFFFFNLNGVIWYIGALLIGSFILYPLAKKINQKFKFVFLLISLALYAIIFVFCKQMDPFSVVFSSNTEFIRYGINIARSVAGLSMGIFIFELTKYNIKPINKKSISILFTVIFFICLIAVIALPGFFQHSLFDILYVVLFFAMGIILAGELGILQQKFNWPCPKFISDYSLTLFLIHWVFGGIFLKQIILINGWAAFGCLMLVYALAVPYIYLIRLFKKVVSIDNTTSQKQINK